MIVSHDAGGRIDVGETTALPALFRGLLQAWVVLNRYGPSRRIVARQVTLGQDRQIKGARLDTFVHALNCERRVTPDATRGSGRSGLIALAVNRQGHIDRAAEAYV